MKSIMLTLSLVCYAVLAPIQQRHSLCSCIYNTTTFCSGTGENTLLVHILERHSEDFAVNYTAEVIDARDATRIGDTITIAGSNGGNCVIFFGGEVGEYYLFNLWKPSSDTYEIGSCGNHALRFERDSLFGLIRPEVFKMSYTDFIADYDACLSDPPRVRVAATISSWRHDSIGIGDLDFKVNEFDTRTWPHGSFSFDYAEIIPGADSLSPITLRSNAQVLRGVSTRDIVLISRHILGVDILSEAEQLVAADVDQSGHISTFDMILLRQLILGQIAELPHGHSWLFVRPDYSFEAHDNQWVSDEANVFRMSNYELEGANFPSFKVIKIGDVDGSI